MPMPAAATSTRYGGRSPLRAATGLLLVLLAAAQAFVVPTTLSPPRTRTFSAAAPSPPGASLRDRFFAAVEYELAQRFPDPTEIARVLRFVQSCKAGTIPPEAPTNLPFYQPSEEYVPGLSARPWHDPYSFPWVKPLEEATPLIQEELRQALAAQQEGDFKGDSNVQKVMGSGWTALRLQRFGIWNEDVCARFPQTVKVRKEEVGPGGLALRKGDCG